MWKVAKVAGVELGNSLLQPFIGRGRASFLQPSQSRGIALSPSSALAARALESLEPCTATVKIKRNAQTTTPNENSEHHTIISEVKDDVNNNPQSDCNILEGRSLRLKGSNIKQISLMNTDLFELYRNAFYVLKNNRINQKENFAILYNLEGQLTCLGTNSQYPVSALIQEIYSLITTGNDDIAIQTDLVIVKSESQNRTTIFCQVSNPSLAAVPQDQCETMMETVHRQFTDIFDECTDNLCFMTINREGWSALTPEKLACQTPRNSNKGQIKQITDNLSNIRQNSLVLNRALGTGLYANLEGSFLRCNIDMNKSFYHIGNANIEQCEYQNISSDETVEREELEPDHV